MLFVLTGGVQTGKTRWLERLVEDLKAEGVEPCGVIAPGIWADRRDEAQPNEHVDANGFEKLGIDNVLLPTGERIRFAQRADLAESSGHYDDQAQSARARLAWHIAEDAIERVNNYFATLFSQNGVQSTTAPRMLIVDELGRLELLHGGGLTDALAVLENGPRDAMPHALIVVRKDLLPHLEGRFESWGEKVPVAPDDASAAKILGMWKRV